MTPLHMQKQSLAITTSVEETCTYLGVTQTGVEVLEWSRLQSAIQNCFRTGGKVTKTTDVSICSGKRD